MTSSSRNAQYAENVGRHTGYSRKSPLSNHSRVIPISFITRTFNLRILFMSNKSRPIMPSVPFGGDDCDRPACDDVKDAMTKSGLQFERTKRQPNFATKDVATTDCPVNTSQLGRSSWTLLHSVAAWFPDSPSKLDQTTMIQLINGLARFYPCTHCAADFQQNLIKSPVTVQTREDLAMWACKQHNTVNEKLGKPLFQCNMKALDERWRKSSNPKCRPTEFEP